MKIYAVGGAVRDALLGLPVQDRDYVVIGATPDDMVARGFTPVGKDFPVFLHPKTHEEYALARTERKTAPGYRGFVFHADCEVTLEQDLARRDLTINAIAQAQDGTLIDPFGGQRDVQAKVFRHVSDAFAEDPVRILRVARFAARFTDFTVAPETNALMQRMVESGEVDALVPERVWQELARGLREEKPSRMFAVLRDCGALARVLPELDALWGATQASRSCADVNAGDHAMRVLDAAAAKHHALPVRFAALMQNVGKGTKPGEQQTPATNHAKQGVKQVEAACLRLRVPHDCRDLAIMTAREHDKVVKALEMSAAHIVDLLQRCDAFRKPQRFTDMLCAVECDCFNHAFPQAAYLQAKLSAALAVPAGDIATETARLYPSEPQRIPLAVRQARIEAVSVKTTS